MAVRIRQDGSIVCAAMHPAMPGDTYLHDGLHYRLSVELKVLVTEPHERHEKHGRWWWANEVPRDVTIDVFYRTGNASGGGERTGASIMSAETTKATDGGPAFPTGQNANAGNPQPDRDNGMSLRDYFAAQALNGFCSNPAVFAPNGMSGWGLVNCRDYELVRYCYELADRAIECREDAKAESR